MYGSYFCISHVAHADLSEALLARLKVAAITAITALNDIIVFFTSPALKKSLSVFNNKGISVSPYELFLSEKLV